MPHIPGKKNWIDCCLVTGETVVEVPPNDHPSDLYSSDSDNPQLFDRNYVLILHKYI
jgi:hypothetical protein